MNHEERLVELSFDRQAAVSSYTAEMASTADELCRPHAEVTAVLTILNGPELPA